VRALIQRVKTAQVKAEGRVVSETGRGLLVFLGVMKGDTDEDLRSLARKVAALRIFEDPGGKMNQSVKDVGGEVLVVSQFTLAADTRKGNRPSFVEAEEPSRAEALYRDFMERLTAEGVGKVRGGRFAARMEVSLVNDGPVTIMLDSRG
jgi:D-tyrosyl-tRNA(Tyr) deacylase